MAVDTDVIEAYEEALINGEIELANNIMQDYNIIEHWELDLERNLSYN